MAELIQQTVDTSDISDPQEMFDAVFRQIGGQELDKRFLAAFDALPKDRQLEILLNHYGDEAIRALLNERRETALLEADPSRWLESLLRESRKTGWLPTYGLPQGVRMVLKFFDHRTISDGTISPEKVVRHFTLESVGDGRFRVWRDETKIGEVRKTSDHPALITLRSRKFGGRNWHEGLFKATTASYTYQPSVHHGASAASINDSSCYSEITVPGMVLWLGSCTVDGQEAFLAR